MITEIIFASSGCVIALLLLAKLWEGRRSRPVLVLALISRSDERLRRISHQAAERYTQGKERAEFFLNKQLPLRTKNFIQKTNALVKEKALHYVGDIRGSKFLKKSEGLSEFFQNLSEKESGRIDDTFEQ